MVQNEDGLEGFKLWQNYLGVKLPGRVMGGTVTPWIYKEGPPPIQPPNSGAAVGFSPPGSGGKILKSNSETSHAR